MLIGIKTPGTPPPTEHMRLVGMHPLGDKHAIEMNKTNKNINPEEQQ